MVLDAQPLEDEADYGRLIELEGRGDFSEEKLPPPLQRLLGLPNPCPRFFLYCMDGEKRRAVEKQIHEGGKAGKRPALTGRSVFCRQRGTAFFVWTFRS